MREFTNSCNLCDYYTIKDVLGKGKFGTVVSAIHKSTQSLVAIKRIGKKSMSDQDLELVRREIEIMKVCQHPNLIRLLDIFENESEIFLVMDLLSGGDLFDYLEHRKFNLTE